MYFSIPEQCQNEISFGNLHGLSKQEIKKKKIREFVDMV